MKKLYFLIPVVLVAVHFLFRGCGTGQESWIPVPFNQGWLFIRQDSANMDKILPGNIPNHKWQEVSLPHTANIEPAVVTGKQWTGICWYKKILRVDRSQKQDHIALLFEGAMNDAIIYLNGVEIYHNTGGYLPFYVDLTNDLNYGRDNEILVKLNNRENPQIPPGKPLSQLDFLYYSGIYRNVSLICKDKLHITNAVEADTLLGGGVITGVTYVNSDSAIVVVSTLVRNDDKILRSFSLVNSILDAGGNVAATSSVGDLSLEPGQNKRVEMKLHVMKPALWSPEQPFLYTLATELTSEKGIIDRNETRFGIRTVKISYKGLLINDIPVKITGTNRHQEYPYLGYALSDNANYRDAYKIKEAGFNFVRCSHYPQSPAFLDACDELGILVMDAIPGWQFIGDSAFCDASVENAKLMCRRDRNHPSVIIWESSLNETWMPYSFLRKLHLAVKDELPYGNNYTASWMDTICDVFIPARQHAKAPDYWKKYPKHKPLFICEYGDWEYYANNAGFDQTEFRDLAPAMRNSRQLRSAGERGLLQQAFNYQEAHNDNLYGPAIGDANWLMYDYNRGYAPDIESSGVMDIFRLPKFSYWFYRSQGDIDPVCFIACYNMPASGNKVRVFSNADSVSLFINDTLIARQAPDINLNTTNLKHPPFTFHLKEYREGTLKAVGTKNGRLFAEHNVSTPKPASKLRLAADISNKPLRADGVDAVFIYSTITDSLGNQVFNADSLITFSISGKAEFIGQNPVKAEAGIATILVRTSSPGKVVIRAKGNRLSAAELMLEARK